MIPTRRLLWLAAVPLLVLLAARGAPEAIVPVWILLGLVVLAFLGDGLLAGRRLPLRIERRVPAQLYVDQPHRIELMLENLSPLPLAFQFSDQVPAAARAEPSILEVTAAPRSRATIQYELTPTRRGPTAFGDIDYRILGPLGLAWRQQRLPARLPIRCLPNLANAKTAELAERQALMRQIGSHRYRWRGAGTVFESLREYSPQDDIRWVDWKATSRLNRPITRNFDVDRHQQVVLLVDSSRAMSTYCGHRTKFDAMLEAAVLVSRAALNQGDGLGLLAFAEKIDLYLEPRRERAQLTAVMEHLYDREPRLVEPNYEAALTLAAQRNLRRTLFILFTDVTVIEAARRMLGYLRIVTARHLLLVVTIADETLEQDELREPQTAEDLYRVGVATELMYERTLLLEEMRRSGAEVLDSRADQVATRAIERYLDLKRRLRL